MTGWHKPLRRFAFAALLLAVLGGCAVVPYGPPHHHYYPDRVYGPPVVVPLPYFHWRHEHYGNHWHGRGHRGHRGHH